MKFKGAHILSVSQFEIADIFKIIQVAQQMEKYTQRASSSNLLNGAILANLFFEPSTRTRMSFASAFNRLGGVVDNTVGFSFSSMAKGESIYDSSRVISGYVDIMVVRHPDQGAVAQFAEASLVPVINGGDGIGEHPSQALLDLYTIFKEKKNTKNPFDNLKIALMGDLKNGRTVHSLSKILSLFNNVSFTFIAPEPLGMPLYILELIKQRGHKIAITDNLEEGIQNQDVIYTTRIQEERFSSPVEFAKYNGLYALDKATYEKHAQADAIIMHPLPRDSRNQKCEIASDLNTHPNLAIFRQADNGVPLRMALFAMVMGVTEQ